MSEATKKKAAEAVTALTMRSRPEPMLGEADYLDSGLTLLNLASTGAIDRCVPRGTILRLVGRKSTAKSFVATMIQAMAARSPHFAKYDLVYDDKERGRRMDLDFFFGAAAAKRIGPPGWFVNKEKKTKRPAYSDTVGDLYAALKARLDKGKPVVWVVDSVDSLASDKTTKMSDGKAQANNRGIRDTIEGIDATGSILILISQARPDINNTFGGDVTSGGLGLEYYPSMDVWFKRVMGLVRSYNGVVYRIGELFSAHVKKNRVSGADRSFNFPFAPTYGIDDLGACVDWLCRVKHWEKESVKKRNDAGGDDDESRLVASDRTILAPEFNFQGSRRQLLKKVEAEDLARELRVLTGRVWNQIEDALVEDRKPRFS